MVSGHAPRAGRTRGLRPPFLLGVVMEGYYVLLALVGASWILFR